MVLAVRRTGRLATIFYGPHITTSARNFTQLNSIGGQDIDTSVTQSTTQLPALLLAIVDPFSPNVLFIRR